MKRNLKKEVLILCENIQREVNVMFSQYAGLTTEQAHKILRSKFITRQVVFGPSITNMSVVNIDLVKQ